jgi:molybdopterin-guanine dinucleotide biosynthesis protein A
MKSGAILAGGMGRRLGKPKMYLKYGEQYLYEVLYGRLSKVTGEVMIILSEGVSIPRTKEGLTFLYDDEKYSGSGPLGGIYTALKACRGDTLFVCGVDMPFVSGEIARYLLELLPEKGTDAVIPVSGGKVHSLCAAYSKGSSEKIKSMLDNGVRRASRVIEFLETFILEEDDMTNEGITVNSLININTLDDMKRIRKYLSLDKGN